MQFKKRNLFCFPAALLCVLIMGRCTESFAAGHGEKTLPPREMKRCVKASYSGGSGTDIDPYKIGSATDWTVLSATPEDWDKHFRLITDIDYAGALIPLVAPDMEMEAGFQGTVFSGVFDGNGHVLRNGQINLPDKEYVGMFGYLGIGGSIHHLSLEEIDVTGGSFVGGLVGYNMGSVSSCYMTGTVTGTGTYDDTGGLVGLNESVITACHTAATVTGTGIFGKAGGLVSTNWGGTISSCYASGQVTKLGVYGAAGGLAGENGYGTISDCYSSGAISGNHYVGGLVGTMEYGIVDACYAVGAVTGGEGSTTLGGLVGYNRNSQITASHAAGSVTGTDRVGGMVGHNGTDYASGMISSCYATGTVSGNDYVGGFAGYNSVYAGDGRITSSYATGTVSGNNYVGGFIGYHYRDNWDSTINYCYATGAVTGFFNTGGLIGYDFLYVPQEEGEGEGDYKKQSKGVTSSCYWNMESTKQNSSAGGFGRTTDDMTYPYAEDTYEGWDFGEVWAADTDHTVNKGYPYLVGNSPCVFTPAICVYHHEDKCMTPECYTFSDCSLGAEVLSRQWAVNGVNRTTDVELYECFDYTDTYTVTLTLVTECGVFVATEALFVEVLPSWGAYNAYFEVNTHSGSAPLTVQFTDLSVVEGECAEIHWQWNFGDGIECRDCEGDSFSHTFPAPGTYLVCLHTECYEWECKGSDATGRGTPKDMDWCEVITVFESEEAHPADADGDWRLGMSEAIAYLTGWQQGSHPMTHAIRAAYIWQNGEQYRYDPAADPPLCWILNTNAAPLSPLKCP